MLFEESRKRWVLPLGIVGWALATGVIARLAEGPHRLNPSPGTTLGYVLACGFGCIAFGLVVNPDKPPGLRVKGSILADILDRERKRVLCKLGSRQPLEPNEVEALYDMYQAVIDFYEDRPRQVFQATGRLVEPRDVEPRTSPTRLEQGA